MVKWIESLLAIAGVICTTIGIVKSCSREYKLATGLGVAVPEVQVMAMQR